MYLRCINALMSSLCKCALFQNFIEAWPGFTISRLEHLLSKSRFWATVCKTVRPMLSDRCLSVCLSCLSVCLSCLWRSCTVAKRLDESRWNLARMYGLGPGHIVLDGDPAPPSQKSERSPPPKKIGPCLLWPNGWMDQDGIWHGGRPQPRGLCVRWGPSTA